MVFLQYKQKIYNELNMFQPVIKWSGSKRSQANEILKYFPKEINTYYEPFCGGCSVLRTLIESDIRVNRYVCSDLNEHLIELWKAIKASPEVISEDYRDYWNKLNEINDQATKRAYFEGVRDDFNYRLNNETRASQFMFLNRTCFNGLVRYNSDGYFNTSFHLNRNGIKPDVLKKIIFEWSDLLNKNNVEFRCRSYENVIPKNEDDFVYLDPPYAKSVGMYNGAIYTDKLFDYLRKLPCGYAMSFDGVSGEIDNTYNVPKDVYNEHHYIKSGNSSFKRIKMSSNDSIVYESLYIK